MRKAALLFFVFRISAEIMHVHQIIQQELPEELKRTKCTIWSFRTDRRRSPMVKVMPLTCDCLAASVW